MLQIILLKLINNLKHKDFKGVFIKKVLIKYVKKLDYKQVESLIKKIIKKKNFGRVIIKPNLCFAERIPGATTSPKLIKYVTRYFVKNSEDVIVVESDALLNTADEAFDNLGIRKTVEREGGKIVNLTKYYKEKKYDYLKKPFMKYDLFVNLPVLKTHEFALITGAVKNMFGMVPEMRRIKYHPVLEKILVKLCKIYKNQLIIMDGIYAMEGHGPTRGRTVKMNILIAGKNPAAVDEVVAKIMKIPLKDAPHIIYAKKMLNVNKVDINCIGTSLEKCTRKFKRPQLDPITATKMWVWRHSIPNNIFFASRAYKITRFFGLRIRKFVRWLMRMERID